MSVTIDDKKLYGSMGELENSVLILFWVGDKPKLGSLSVTLPDNTSSQLLGDRDMILSKIIGDRIASLFGKIVLVSTNLPIDFDYTEVLKLLNNMLSVKNEKS